jgi:hypothetical protein
MTYFTESDAAHIETIRGMIARRELNRGALASFARDRASRIQETIRSCTQSDIGWRMFLERRYWSMIDLIGEARGL